MTKEPTSDGSQKIAVLGGGAWGTALATVAVRTGAAVAIWAREASVVAAINGEHENTDFLPGVPLENARAVMDAMERYAGFYT